VKGARSSKYIKAMQSKKGGELKIFPFQRAWRSSRRDGTSASAAGSASGLLHVPLRRHQQGVVANPGLPVPSPCAQVRAECLLPVFGQGKGMSEGLSLDPPVIHYDAEKFHMVVDEERCLGAKCAKCLKACPAKVPRFYPPTTMWRWCVTSARKTGCAVRSAWRSVLRLRWSTWSPSFPQHMQRIHPDEKANIMAERLQPLPRNKAQISPEELFGGKKMRETKFNLLEIDLGTGEKTVVDVTKDVKKVPRRRGLGAKLLWTACLMERIR